MTDRVCAYDEHPAIAICSGCGEDICALCHRAALTGYAVCAHCGERVAEVLQTRWERASTVPQAMHAFLFTSVAVLGSGRTFFATLPSFGPVFRPILFGAIAYTIGAEAASLWSWLFVDSFPELIEEAAKQTSMTPEAAFAATLVVLPFIAPFIILLHAVLMHGSLKVFGASARFGLVCRIVGYSSAAYLFQLIPPIAEFPVGHLLTVVWLVNVQMVAIRRYFDLGLWRSMAVVFVSFLVMVAIGSIG